MSLTKVSYSMITGAPVNVLDFGAVGNGVADDTAAIQAAIDAVEAAGGGQVKLPTGTYKITFSLTITGAVPVWITGTWASVLSNKGVGNTITVGNASANQTADIRILGISIQGQAGTLDGIQILRIQQARVEGVRIKFMGGNGLSMAGCYASWILNSYFNNNGSNGISFTGYATAGSDFMQVIGNRLLANGAKGILVDNTAYGPAGMRIENNDFEGNAIGLTVITGSATNNNESFTLVGNYFENNFGSNMSIGEDAGTSLIRGLVIQGNFFTTGPNGGNSAVTNDVRLGSKVRELSLIGNTFATSDFVEAVGVTLGISAGNRSSTTMPPGYRGDGTVSVDTLFFHKASEPDVSMTVTSGLMNVNYPFQSFGEIYPGSASVLGNQTTCGVWAGTGAPNNANGSNGHFYFRSDTPATANQRIYVKSGGSWVGIV